MDSKTGCGDRVTAGAGPLAVTTESQLARVRNTAPLAVATESQVARAQATETLLARVKCDPPLALAIGTPRARVQNTHPKAMVLETLPAWERSSPQQEQVSETQKEKFSTIGADEGNTVGAEETYSPTSWRTSCGSVHSTTSCSILACCSGAFLTMKVVQIRKWSVLPSMEVSWCANCGTRDTGTSCVGGKRRGTNSSGTGTSTICSGHFPTLILALFCPRRAPLCSTALVEWWSASAKTIRNERAELTVPAPQSSAPSEFSHRHG